MKPRPLMMVQVMMIRFSQARASSTVRPDLEKFIISRAMDAVTTAAMVEIATICPYTSFIISLAFCHTFVVPPVPAPVAKTCVPNRGISRRIPEKTVYNRFPTAAIRPRLGIDGVDVFNKIPPDRIIIPPRLIGRLGVVPVPQGKEKATPKDGAAKAFAVPDAVLSIVILSYGHLRVKGKTMPILC